MLGGGHPLPEIAKWVGVLLQMHPLHLNFKKLLNPSLKKFSARYIHPQTTFCATSRHHFVPPPGSTSTPRHHFVPPPGIRTPLLVSSYQLISCLCVLSLRRVMCIRSSREYCNLTQLKTKPKSKIEPLTIHQLS